MPVAIFPLVIPLIAGPLCGWSAVDTDPVIAIIHIWSTGPAHMHEGCDSLADDRFKVRPWLFLGLWRPLAVRSLSHI